MNTFLKVLMASVFLFALRAGAGEEPAYLPKLLGAKTSGETIEYEFKGDGRLIAYIYTEDDSESGLNARFEQLTPRFQVLYYKWRMEGSVLILLMGKRELRVTSTNWNRPDRTARLGELVFHKIEKLTFFELLSSFCERKGEAEETVRSSSIPPTSQSPQ